MCLRSLTPNVPFLGLFFTLTLFITLPHFNLASAHRTGPQLNRNIDYKIPSRIDRRQATEPGANLPPLFPDDWVYEPISRKLAAAGEKYIQEYELTAWAKNDSLSHLVPMECYTMGNDPERIQVCPEQDIEVWSVRYPDCPEQPWTLCRCKSQDTMTIENMASVLGRISPHARNFVKVFTAFHTTPVSTAAAWAYWGHSIATLWPYDMSNPLYFNFLTHEVGHTIETTDEGVNAIANSPEFISALEKDSCVVSWYAQASQGGRVENVAELTDMVFLNAVDRVEFEKLWVDYGFSCFENQFNVVWEQMGKFFDPNYEECPVRLYKEYDQMVEVKRDIGMQKSHGKKKGGHHRGQFDLVNKEDLGPVDVNDIVG